MAAAAVLPRALCVPKSWSRLSAGHATTHAHTTTFASPTPQVGPKVSAQGGIEIHSPDLAQDDSTSRCPIPTAQDVPCVRNDDQCQVACTASGLCLCGDGADLEECCADNPCCSPCIEDLEVNSVQYLECTMSSCFVDGPASCSTTVCP